jgi:hypothetical protein
MGRSRALEVGGQAEDVVDFRLQHLAPFPDRHLLGPDGSAADQDSYLADDPGAFPTGNEAAAREADRELSGTMVGQQSLALNFHKARPSVEGNFDEALEGLGDVGSACSQSAEGRVGSLDDVAHLEAPAAVRALAAFPRVLFVAPSALDTIYRHRCTILHQTIAFNRLTAFNTDRGRSGETGMIIEQESP